MVYSFLSHHCRYCDFETDISNLTASAHPEYTYCTRCGTASPFDPSQAPSTQENSTMNHQLQYQQKPSEMDTNLSDLFAHHMSLSATAPTSNPTPPPDAQQNQQQAQKPVYYSAHYTHTKHVVPIRFVQDPPTPQVQPISDLELYGMLAEAHIHPASLTDGQRELFRNAQPDQRHRLLQLWNISPGQPSSASPQPPPANIQSSTGHWIQQQAGNSGQHLTYPDPHQRPASAPETHKAAYAEPYMLSGYEMLARREYEATMQHSDMIRDAQRANVDPAWKSMSNGPICTAQDTEMVM